MRRFIAIGLLSVTVIVLGAMRPVLASEVLTRWVNYLDTTVYLKGNFPLKQDMNEPGYFPIGPRDKIATVLYHLETYQVVLRVVNEPDLVLEEHKFDKVAYDGKPVNIAEAYLVVENRTGAPIKVEGPYDLWFIAGTNEQSKHIDTTVTFQLAPGETKSVKDPLYKKLEEHPTRDFSLPFQRRQRKEFFGDWSIYKSVDGAAWGARKDYRVANTGVKHIRYDADDAVPLPDLKVYRNRRYDEQSYLMAHNSFASWDEGFPRLDSQQSGDVGWQFSYGARAFEIDVYIYDPGDGEGLYLCHRSCSQTQQFKSGHMLALSAYLSDVKFILSKHPTEIITIFIEADKSITDAEKFNRMLLGDLERTGLMAFDNATNKWTSRVFWPDRHNPLSGAAQDARSVDDGTPGNTASLPTWDVKDSHNTTRLTDRWPRVQEMVDKNQRLVLFIDRQRAVPRPPLGQRGPTQWAPRKPVRFMLPYRWMYARESEYSDRGVLGHFATVVDRWRKGELISPIGDPFLERAESITGAAGAFGRSLVIMNQFPFYGPLSLYSYINDFDAIVARTLGYRDLFGRLPNFLAMDFIMSGDGLRVINLLNQCWPQFYRNRDGDCFMRNQNPSPIYVMGDEL